MISLSGQNDSPNCLPNDRFNIFSIPEKGHFFAKATHEAQTSGRTGDRKYFI